MRKTVTVESLRNHVNHMLTESVDDAKEGRIALHVLLESVLMDTGNYHGFRYCDGNNGETDDTRRVYY